MDASSQNLYPLHRRKHIHLVRSAQEKDLEDIKESIAPMPFDTYGFFSETLPSPFYDAELTPLGWEQVDHLRNHVHSTGLFEQVKLVIVSPLMSAMQTAVGVFGGGYTIAKAGAPPLLMVENACNSNRPAIASLACRSFMATELCREHFGGGPRYRRRSISTYKIFFPAIDFSLITADEDNTSYRTRESNELLSMRGRQFLNWLWTREEKEIAIVTHGDFLTHTLAGYGDDCHASVKSEICKPFNNGELRSFFIVDKSNKG